MSFFEKLKKGMGIELPEEKIEEMKEPEEIKTEEKPTKKRRLIKMKNENKEQEVAQPEMKIEKVELKPEEISGEKMEEKKLTEVPVLTDKEKWFPTEGELAIDVYQTETHLVIQSAIAGVKPEDLDISMERDILTIKGIRQKPFEENGDYFTQECYWGPFSREVILPVEVDPDRAEATMKDGILTIRIPKILREKRRQIKVRI